MKVTIVYAVVLTFLTFFVMPNNLTIKNKKKLTIKYYTNEEYWHRLFFFFDRVKKARKAKKLGTEFDWDEDKRIMNILTKEHMDKEFQKMKEEFVKECIAGGYYENVSQIKPKRKEV